MKRTLSFILIVLIGFSVEAQVKSVKREVDKQGTRRVSRKITKGVNSGLDELEDGIGGLFGKKNTKNKGETQQENTSSETDLQTEAQDFGAFSVMFPANGNVIAYPPFLDWEIPNEPDYTFRVHLEGDDWSEWLTKTTTKTNISFERLPTATTSFRWQVIAKGNGQRLESPWQSFTTSDGSDLTDAKPGKPTAPEMKIEWAKFDFVPGDEVLLKTHPVPMKKMAKLQP